MTEETATEENGDVTQKESPRTGTPNSKPSSDNVPNQANSGEERPSTGKSSKSHRSQNSNKSEGNDETVEHEDVALVESPKQYPKTDVAEHDEEESHELETIEEEMVEALKDSLNKELQDVKLPINFMEEFFAKHDKIFDPENFPVSYKENTAKEELVLQYAANFRRQYVHLYKDRRPLYLHPKNECEIEKFVCTTMNPTKLPFKELYDWEGAASFVSDYLNYVPLDPPTELPETLFAPSTTMEIQKGHSFEFAHMLCSLLIGVGYDAYVVSGYATREICFMDETRTFCPLLQQTFEENETKFIQEPKKYSVKPPKDLTSKYIYKMEKRKADEEKELLIQKAEEAKRLELEAEKPENDPLFGLRIHAWVLVLAGKRGVPESFFIEPLTGVSKHLINDDYLGIESLWNHKNYWVNMQDCSEGVRKLDYDLGDCTQWEFMFPSNEKPEKLLPTDDIMEDDDMDSGKDLDIEKHLDIPPTWTSPFVLKRRDFEMRCPHGKKTKIFKKAKLEKFAPYLRNDGMVMQLSVYNDRELTDLVEIKEYFSNRKDNLKMRNRNMQNNKITEFFSPGRPDRLQEHQYLASSPGPESERTMKFYSKARVDCLLKRTECTSGLEEEYKNREDRLYYRAVSYTKREKKFGPAGAPGEPDLRPFHKIVEMYHRNSKIRANEDVAEKTFIIHDDRIQLTYHTADEKIAGSTREFTKPANAEDKGATLFMPHDSHSTFQIDPNEPSKKQVVIYQLLLQLIRDEQVSKDKIRNSERETLSILNSRSKEEASYEMDVSLFDTERNLKAKKHREELERQEQEEFRRNQELELDYLAPFLAQEGDPNTFTKQLSFDLRKACLDDFKQRLIDKANLIQNRFEKQTTELQKKQAWYQQNQVSMSKTDEEDYLNFCSEAMFRIQILEQMLNRHKLLAPQKFMELEKKLRTDKRLTEFLNNST